MPVLMANSSLSSHAPDRLLDTLWQHETFALGQVPPAAGENAAEQAREGGARRQLAARYVGRSHIFFSSRALRSSGNDVFTTKRWLWRGQFAASAARRWL
jgi:hypothetical protein